MQICFVLALSVLTHTVTDRCNLAFDKYFIEELHPIHISATEILRHQLFSIL